MIFSHVDCNLCDWFIYLRKEQGPSKQRHMSGENLFPSLTYAGKFAATPASLSFPALDGLICQPMTLKVN